jgi:hypothetical protein
MNKLCGKWLILLLVIIAIAACTKNSVGVTAIVTLSGWQSNPDPDFTIGLFGGRLIDDRGKVRSAHPTYRADFQLPITNYRLPITKIGG